MVLTILRRSLFAGIFIALLTVEFHAFNKSAVASAVPRAKFALESSSWIKSTQQSQKKSADPKRI